MRSSTIQQHLSSRGHRAAALALVVSSGVLTACGDSSSRTSAGAGAGKVPAKVTIASSAKINSVDPNRTVQPDDYRVVALTTTGLTTLGDDGVSVEPGLAESWKASSDGLSWTYVLKPGSVFSDGTPVTAADVEASWKHFLAEDNANAAAVGPVESVRARDERTIVFKLASPYASLPLATAGGTFPVYPAAGIAAPKTFFKAPVSAGLYNVERIADGGVTLKANSRYNGPRAQIAEIAIKPVTDPNTRIAQLRSGQADYATGLPPRVEPQLTGKIRPIVQVEPFGGVYLYTNNRRGPLSDARVRKAIGAAIDRAKLAKDVYRDLAKPQRSFFNASSGLAVDVVPPAPDLDEARQLLQGTECASGCAFEMILDPTLDELKAVGAILQQNLKAIGITIKTTTVDQQVGEKQVFGGTYELTPNTLGSGNLPDITLGLGLSKDGGIEALFSGYSDPDLEAAIKDFVASDGQARKAANATINEIYGRDLPFAPLVELITVDASSLDRRVLSADPRTGDWIVPQK